MQYFYVKKMEVIIIKILIINSAPGVGKSTSLKLLEGLLDSKSAFVDGDDLARVIPFENTVKWLNLMQDNIACCVKNFLKYNYENIFISFVFPSSDRINRMKKLIKTDGVNIYHIKLICGQDELKERLVKRNSQKLISIEKALNLNEMINKLKSDLVIDTTNISPLEVARKIKEGIND